MLFPYEITALSNVEALHDEVKTIVREVCLCPNVSSLLLSTKTVMIVAGSFSSSDSLLWSLLLSEDVWLMWLPIEGVCPKSLCLSWRLFNVLLTKKQSNPNLWGVVSHSRSLYQSPVGYPFSITFTLMLPLFLGCTGIAPRRSDGTPRFHLELPEREKEKDTTFLMSTCSLLSLRPAGAFPVNKGRNKMNLRNFKGMAKNENNKKHPLMKLVRVLDDTFINRTPELSDRERVPL